MKHFRIIQEQNGHNIRYRVQILWFWIIWFDYEEEDIALDGAGSCSYPRHFSSVEEAEHFIHDRWGKPREKVVKQITVL